MASTKAGGVGSSLFVVACGSASGSDGGKGYAAAGGGNPSNTKTTQHPWGCCLLSPSTGLGTLKKSTELASTSSLDVCMKVGGDGCVYLSPADADDEENVLPVGHAR